MLYVIRMFSRAQATARDERASKQTVLVTDGAGSEMVDLPVVTTRRGGYMPRAAILLATFLLLAGCSQEEQ